MGRISERDQLGPVSGAVGVNHRRGVYDKDFVFPVPVNAQVKPQPRFVPDGHAVVGVSWLPQVEATQNELLSGRRLLLPLACLGRPSGTGFR